MVITPKASTSTLLKRIAKRESNPCHLSSQANRARELLRRCGTGLATNPSVTLQPLCVYSNGLLAMHLPPKPSDVVALGTPARCHAYLNISLIYGYYVKLIFIYICVSKYMSLLERSARDAAPAEAKRRRRARHTRQVPYRSIYITFICLLYETYICTHVSKYLRVLERPARDAPAAEAKRRRRARHTRQVPYRSIYITFICLL